MFCSWDAFVEKESIARLIDAFVNSLDVSRYGVKPVSVEGRPAYDPKSLYKLYIYGSRKDSRGSKEKKAVHNLGLIRRFVMSLTNWPNNGMLVREVLFMRLF